MTSVSYLHLNYLSSALFSSTRALILSAKQLNCLCTNLIRLAKAAKLESHSSSVGIEISSPVGIRPSRYKYSVQYCRNSFAELVLNKP